MVTCWERDGLLAILYVMFYCVFVTFPCGVLSQVWYLIALIPDLCLLTYFYMFVSVSLYVCKCKKVKQTSRDYDPHTDNCTGGQTDGWIYNRHTCFLYLKAVINEPRHEISNNVAFRQV